MYSTEVSSLTSSEGYTLSKRPSGGLIETYFAIMRKATNLAMIEVQCLLPLLRSANRMDLSREIIR